MIFSLAGSCGTLFREQQEDGKDGKAMFGLVLFQGMIPSEKISQKRWFKTEK